MEQSQLPTVYERYNYNGADSLLVAERDRIVLVLNLKRTQDRTAKILGIGIKTLVRMCTRHRIDKDKLGTYSTANRWD